MRRVVLLVALLTALCCTGGLAGVAADRARRQGRHAARRREGPGARRLSRQGQAVDGPRVGRDQRPPSVARAGAGRLPRRLLGWLGHVSQDARPRLRQRVPAVRGTAARVVRDRLHHAGREPLGPPGVAARAPEPRARPVEASPGDLGAPAEPLDGRPPAARDLDELGLQHALRPSVRPAHVPRPARVRVRARPRRDRRPTASDATSTSTPSTPPTGPAGSARTASSRTAAPARSATASTRTTRTPGYPAVGRRPAGKGQRYRATVVGPGVLPDVTWEGAATRPTTRRSTASSSSSSAPCTARPLCKPFEAIPSYARYVVSIVSVKNASARSCPRVTWYTDLGKVQGLGGLRTGRRGDHLTSRGMRLEVTGRCVPEGPRFPRHEVASRRHPDGGCVFDVPAPTRVPVRDVGPRKVAEIPDPEIVVYRRATSRPQPALPERIRAAVVCRMFTERYSQVSIVSGSYWCGCVWRPTPAVTIVTSNEPQPKRSGPALDSVGVYGPDGVERLYGGSAEAER